MHKVEQIHVDINSRKRRRIAVATTQIYSVRARFDTFPNTSPLLKRIRMSPALILEQQ